ncbi:hypothetical protein B0H63DRAFT_518274 [Podospora didyma]|uniref:Uncharacterized protein n=1 Tax=Podospora didyma TaxID=330526 RepID=A0AAE0P8K7_9PEZI|nr:hypothetical protein B0H63DRAFT_518274 [Podospora didyma]
MAMRKPSIKAAMAANVGSCLFLYNGLLSISPQLFTEAALQCIPSSSPSSTTAKQQLQPNSSSEMGLAPSKPTQVKQAKPPKKHKKEYRFDLVCTGCENRKTPCPTVADYLPMYLNDSGKEIAFRMVDTKPDKKDINRYELRIALCPLVQQDALTILDRHLKSRRGENINIDLLEAMLERKVDIFGNVIPLPAEGEKGPRPIRFKREFYDKEA